MVRDVGCPVIDGRTQTVAVTLFAIPHEFVTRTQ
jgi:hypothetical protein